MTIENLKQIAIKYASTKGSRIPLAPDELCNAVVQYMNSFFGVMTDINTIKVAVTEDSGNIVFTITGNTYDGKPITPIVITVDHNDFVTDQEFEEVKTNILDSINSLNNSITEINNTIKNINDTLENNTTDITGLKNRVDNTETNIAEINSTLDNKLDKNTSETLFSRAYIKLANGDQDFVDINPSSSAYSIPQRTNRGRIYAEKGAADDPSSVANMSNIADVEAKIPDVSGFATKEELKNVQNSLTNKRSVISSPASSYVVYTQANGLESNLPYSELANQTSTNIMARRANGTSDVKKGISGENVANMENIADVEAKIPDVSGFATKEELKNVQNSLTNKRSVISSPASSYVVYTQANGLESNLPYSELANQTSTNIMARRANGTSDVKKGISGENVANMENIADVEAKIPDVSNFATTEDIPSYTDVGSVSYDITNGAIIAYDGAHEIHIPLLAGENVTIDASEDNKKIVISAAGGGGTGDVTAAGNNTFTGENTFTNEITFNTMKSEAGYIQFGNFNYETTEGYDYLYIDNTHINIQKFVGNNQYHEININADLMTYAPPDDNVYYEYRYPRKNGTFALTSDIPDTSSFVTLAGDNTFGGTNTFNNSIYAKNGVVAGDTTNYGANSVTKGSNTYSFPNKSGTFAMTTDIIKNPIYFISFYANEPSEPCHLIGTMMSKNSYGTGQKTNEEFAVMLADNLYTNSNEGLAAYGKLANKDILCIYSEDGLSIRCLDEENSEVDLPTVMFFVMETEL